MRWEFRHRAIIKDHWRDYQSGTERKRQMADPYSDENLSKKFIQAIWFKEKQRL